ncbi:hypothetical protein D3C72_2011480 [compost metagenome]
MTFAAQALHDVDHFWTQGDKHRLPAGSELLETEGNPHFGTQPFGKVFIADFTALVLLKQFAHSKTFGQDRQWRTAQTAPYTQYTFEIDIDDHIT